MMEFKEFLQKRGGVWAFLGERTEWLSPLEGLEFQKVVAAVLNAMKAYMDYIHEEVRSDQRKKDI